MYRDDTEYERDSVNVKKKFRVREKARHRRQLTFYGHVRSNGVNRRKMRRRWWRWRRGGGRQLWSLFYTRRRDLKLARDEVGGRWGQGVVLHEWHAPVHCRHIGYRVMAFFRATNDRIFTGETNSICGKLATEAARLAPFLFAAGTDRSRLCHMMMMMMKSKLIIVHGVFGEERVYISNWGRSRWMKRMRAYN